MALTLTGFLIARIAEDEGVARAAATLAQGVERISTHSLPEFAEYMTHWQPNRTLAECEAKWQRVAMLDDMERHSDPPTPSRAYRLLCLEAAPYADHPDYRAEWKP